MFKLERRMAAITHLNIRTQNMGKDTVKAVDVSMSISGKASELMDVLIPTQNDDDNMASEFFFDKAGHLRAPTVLPLKLDRTPEGLLVTFFDRKEPMYLKQAKAKDFVITCNDGGHVTVDFKVQGVPEKGYTERFKEILASSVDIQIESEQDDLFTAKPDDKKKDDAQGDLLEGGSSAGGSSETSDAPDAGQKPEKAGKRAAPKAKAKAAPKKAKAAKKARAR